MYRPARLRLLSEALRQRDLTLLSSMLIKCVQEARWQLRPMALRIKMMLDVVAIVKGDGIVRASHTIVGHAVGAARIVWVYEDVLAPAPQAAVQTAHLHEGEHRKFACWDQKRLTYQFPNMSARELRQ